MKGNSRNIASSNTPRGPAFPWFQHRTARTIGPFCTRSMGPLSSAQNVGVMLQPTYERVGPKHQKQNSPIAERHVFLRPRQVFPRCKRPVVSYHAECPNRRLIEDTTCCGVHHQHTQFTAAFRILLYLATYTDTVHMRTPRTCTPPIIRRGRAGRLVACHSAFDASPGPFRRESLFRYLLIRSIR